MKKIYPKCIKGEQTLATSSQGHLLPCCWWDKPDLINESNLFRDDLKIENVESIQDILNSEEWVELYNNLKKDLGPPVCQIYCGKKDKKIKII